jgi:hypothetical protein
MVPCPLLEQGARLLGQNKRSAVLCVALSVPTYTWRRFSPVVRFSTCTADPGCWRRQFVTCGECRGDSRDVVTPTRGTAVIFRLSRAGAQANVQGQQSLLLYRVVIVTGNQMLQSTDAAPVPARNVRLFGPLQYKHEVKPATSGLRLPRHLACADAVIGHVASLIPDRQQLRDENSSRLGPRSD